jgi:predicted glycoside hydrolase/deacetylase ChbG (UPF0249 family)
MPRLIVNADDFGYTAGVNRAIFELHAAGAVSSATLMANGAALDDALSAVKAGQPRAPALGELGIGCHVVLVDGAPVSAPAELPTLAPQGASFRPTLGSFVADLVRGRIHDAEIEREAIAQIRLLQARGVRLTHLDTHKHTHMFPRVLRPLLRAALACGIKAIRNPFEPAWSVRATPNAPLIRRAEVRLLSLLRPEFARLVAQAGLHTTSGALGVLATGTLDARTIERLLAAALRLSGDAEPTWELVCHPGYHDAALEAQPTRLLAAREIERVALLATLPILERFTLMHFGELSG